MSSTPETTPTNNSASMTGIGAFPPVRWALRHPRLAAWAVLSIGMIILLVIEARDVGLLPGQWIALMVACVLVAGACIWIVSWEDDEDEDMDAVKTDTVAVSPTPNAALRTVDAPDTAEETIRRDVNP